MSKKSEKEVQELIAEINELVKIRHALSFGSNTGKRQAAESIMSRRINRRVMQLSEEIEKLFGKDE